MLASYVLLLFLPLATNAICPTTLPTDAAFATGAQYHSGDYGSASSTHLLSLSSSAPSSSFSLAYNLASGSFMKTPSTQCPSSCLNRLRAMGKPGKDGSSSSIVMLWDAAGQSPPATNLLYAAYTTTVLPGEYLYCSNVAGTCGASVPLYLYYNAETDDYQLRNDKDTVDDAAARLQNMGLPVCWMFPALPTTSSSTSTVTNGTHIRLARGANESNATVAGKPNEILTDNLAHPNSSTTEDQRPKINKLGTLPAWYNSTNRPSENRTDRFMLPTVTSHLPAGHRTGTSGTVSMDPKMERRESADSIRPYGNGRDVTARDGNETATKRPREEMSQEGKDLLGWGTGSVADLGKERGKDLLEKGKNATGSATDLPKDLRIGEGWGSFTGIISNVNVSAIDQMKDLGRGRMEKALGNVGTGNGSTDDQMKDWKGSLEKAAGIDAGGNDSAKEQIKEMGKNLGGNGSVTDLMSDHVRNMVVNSTDQPKDKKFEGVNLGSIFGGLAGGLGGKAVDAIKDRFSSLRNVTLPPGNQSIDEFEQNLKEKMMDKAGNGSEVVSKNQSVSSFLQGVSSEKIEKKLAEAGISLPSNVTVDKVLAYFKNLRGNATLGDLVKGGGVEKALETMGITVPSNFSVMDLLPLMGKDKTDPAVNWEEKKEGKMEDDDKYKPISSTLVDWKERMEEIMKGYDTDKNSSDIVDWKEKMKEKLMDGNGSEVVKKKWTDTNEHFAKALAALGIDVPSNVSTGDVLKALGKEEGKDKNGLIEKALISLGIDVPSNVSASDIMMELVKGKDKSGGIGKTLESLGIDVPSNFSATELIKNLGKDDKDKSSDGKKISVINLMKDLGKDTIEKAMSSLGIDVPRNFSSTDLLKELEKDNGGGDFIHVLNASLGVLDKDDKEKNRTLHDAVNKDTVVAVDKIFRRFNTSLAQVHPSFNDDNSSILIATIPFPSKLSEEELAQARNETAEVKEVRVFDDRLTVYGGDVEAKKDQKDVSVENGTWSPGITGETRRTRIGTEGTRRPHDFVNGTRPTQSSHGTMITGANPIGTGGESKQSNQSNQTIQTTIANQIVTDIKGSSTTTSSGSSSTSTVSGSTTSTVVSGVEGVEGVSSTAAVGSSTTSPSGAYTGSSTTSTPYTGPPTSSTTADPAASSTTPLPYTGPPTTSTTPAPYTDPSTTADPAASTTTASSGSSMTTVRPTTTTSPYVYAATTDAAGTYGPGDQKLENGTVIRPNGDTIYPNGTVKTGDGSIIEGGKKTDPDGTVHNPDGSTKYPNGTVVYPSDVAGSGGGKSDDDTPTWVIPVIIVGSMIVGVGSLAMIVFGVTSMMKSAPPSTVNPYEVPNSREQWPNQRQPTPPSADLPPPVSEPVMTAQPQSFGATQTLAGGPNPLYFG